MRTIIRLSAFILFLNIFPQAVFSQNISFPKPREEKLLNDLKLLIWNQQNADKITVKLRIHSGSAFDQTDKMGTIALLSDILFPDDGIKDFFKDELEGSLKIDYGYDYIQITAVSKPGQLLTILETLSPAIVNPTIDKELTEKVKAKRLELLKKLERDPNYVGEREAAKQLFGDFPYGRPIEGTTESVGKIDFADLIFAKQRFLTSDNATMTVSGNVSSTFAYRAVRRLFGGWGKRTEKVPSMFRLPDKPNTSVVNLTLKGAEHIVSTNAANSVARKDDAYFASNILERIIAIRSAALKSAADITASQQSYLLRGAFFLSVRSDSDAAPAENKKDLFSAVLAEKITNSEFESARSSLLNDFRMQDPAELWLDIDTFQLQSAGDETKRLLAVSLADVQKAADEILAGPRTSVEIGPPKDAPVDQTKDPKDPR
ncbi:MAG: insulinase family protein [Acidobacteria bacterium]|nr:insulinase family protein [Acidobacteriota bacterium]